MNAYTQFLMGLSPLEQTALYQRLSTEAKRRKARTNLIGFTEWTMPRYRAASVHRQIAGQLERVMRGEIDRLMLLVPPRHGKSELASRRFPAFYLGRDPTRQFISASASSPLADDFGRDVRNIIASQEYGELFDTRLAEDSQARGRWHTSAGGAYYAVGIGGMIMGRGAHVFMIDDPFGSMLDARSEAKRREVWDWYTGTAYNRLEDGGAIVLINHRMHEDDLSGRLLAQQAAGGDRWEVVELKALNAAGDALWSEKYPVEVLERIRRNTKASDWSALYMQNPTPEDGTYFQSDWFRPYTADQRPDLKTLRIYGGSDYAVTADGGDYTVHAVLGVDPEGKIWLLDIWRKQAASNEWVEAFCDLVRAYHPEFWAEELVQITSGVGPFLDAMQIQRKAWTVREQFPVRGDKGIRAQSIRGRMALQGLYVPTDAAWWPDVRSELLHFPFGKHDDIVDALGLVGQLMDKYLPGERPEHPPPEVRDGYYSPVDEMQDKYDSILGL